MELEPTREDQAIRLGWFYLTDFRYRMKRDERKYPMKIADLCAAARLNVGQPHDRGRFLGRLAGWHKRLQEVGVLGGYEREPGNETNWPPARVFAEGTYRATPPRAILDTYQRART